MARRGLCGILAALVLSGQPAFAQDAPLGRFSFSVLGVSGQSVLTNSGVHYKGFAEVTAPVIESTMFISRRSEIGFSVNPWIGVSQPVVPRGKKREFVSAFAADLLFRWFPGNLAGRVHPYVEIADGPSIARRRVPANGTPFNFLSQAGFGIVIERADRWWIHLGYRWVHFSNAGLGSNPSWNFNGLLLGGRLALGKG